MDTLTIYQDDPSVKELCERDPSMKKLITIIGDLNISLRTNYLASIVRSIIGQQISVPASKAIHQRLTDSLEGQLTVEGLLAKTKDELRDVGLTNRKVDYIKDLAEKVATGTLDLENISNYSDEEVIRQLTHVKGIGKWTAEMFLMLTLGRKDILAVDDVGLQRAAMWLYGVEKSERRQVLIDQSPLWKPYRSIVSFYLWEAIHLGLLTKYPSIERGRELR
ncbi:MAG TPA: DNA-3-methyladenine glycosylase 2 family protein [Bacillota bacterium]|nr:DNA-3-methyladenine glycosylase 2 family protein [Bacillota bacterium]